MNEFFHPAPDVIIATSLKSAGISMAKMAPRCATYEDLLQVPEHRVAEIVNGELHTHPRPAPRHALAASALDGTLFSPFHGKGNGGPGGWWILMEPELHLGDHVLVPDLAGWRRERMPMLPDTAWFELFPDWVCEILSPATARRDRVEKMPIYAAQAISHLWLVDPDLKMLEAYRLHEGQWLLLKSLSGDASEPIEPFDAIEFSLSVLWG